MRSFTISVLMLAALGTPWAHAQTQRTAAEDRSSFDRTVAIAALDSKRFSIEELYVRPGETVRFVVTNEGLAEHYFSVATSKEHAQHVAALEDHSENRHSEANVLLLRPKETKSLDWRFSADAQVEIACLIPAHYEAGMATPVTSQFFRPLPPGRRHVGPRLGSQ